MRIEAAPDGSSPPHVQFVVYAENTTERALLTQFTNHAATRGRGLQFWMHGHTYECDYHAVTSFSFGWIDPKKFYVPLYRRVKFGWKRFVQKLA